MLQHLSLRKIFFVLVLAAAVFFATAQSGETGENPGNQQASKSSEQEIRSLAPPDEPPEIIAAKAPATSDSSPPGPKEPLQISYTPCSKAGGDLIFTFSLPMVKKDTLKTAGHPEVSFKPKQKGTFTWRSPTELVFRPSKGFMNGGHYISMSINKAVPLAGEEYALKDPWRAKFTIPYLEIAGKVANWPIIKGRPRFVSFLNWYTGQIGRGPLFLL